MHNEKKERKRGPIKRSNWANNRAERREWRELKRRRKTVEKKEKKMVVVMVVMARCTMAIQTGDNERKRGKAAATAAVVYSAVEVWPQCTHTEPLGRASKCNGRSGRGKEGDD